MILNVVTPVVLIALGFIQPEIRKIQDKKEARPAPAILQVSTI